jgi:hypothetical protein
MMEVIERPGNSTIPGEAHDMSILWGRGEKLRLFFYPDKHEVDRQAVVESALVWYACHCSYPIPNKIIRKKEVRGRRIWRCPNKMKIRSDFITNSSSSSFILAQRGAFSEKQKEAILKYAVKKLLGKSELTPESTEEDVRKVFNDYSVDDEYQEQIRQALVEGKSIRFGYVGFECCEDSYVDMFTELWEALKKSDPDAFTIIDDDLDY